MAMLGRAALAMWWDMAPERRAEFEHWHTHEHFPERLGIPGFLRASRWRGEGEGFFVLYELASHEVLGSAPYLRHLNAPSPWSTQLMPHHRHMVRTQCHVLASHGAALARHAWTVRLSPRPGQEDTLRAALTECLRAVVSEPGFSGGHLLRHQAPDVALTTEQKIRGGDQAADWVLLVTGYESDTLARWSDQHLSGPALQALGAQAGALAAPFSLSATATPADVSEA